VNDNGVSDALLGAAPSVAPGGTLLADLDYAVVDVETTGLTPRDAGITEIGAVRVRQGAVVGEFTSLVNPGLPIPAEIQVLTGIDDEMLASAPSVASMLPGLLAFADGCVLTAHNARFDLSFLTAACEAAGVPWPGFPVLDTVRLARYLMAVPDEVPDCKLGTLAAFFGSPAQPSHRALADARATAEVLTHLISRLAERGVTTLDELAAWLAEQGAAEEAARARAPRATRWPRWLRWLYRAAHRLGGRGDSLRPWLPR
jgi:DNA polymerase-3 subunit epsilon